MCLRARLVIHMKSVDEVDRTSDDEHSGQPAPRTGTTVTSQGIQALVRCRIWGVCDTTWKIHGRDVVPSVQQASLLSQPTSPMFSVRSLAISGLYLSYESMATIAYRILVRTTGGCVWVGCWRSTNRRSWAQKLPRLRSLNLAENLFDETTATNVVYMLRVS